MSRPMTPVEQRARYADRKARRVCVDCEAGLQQSDGVHCVEHREMRRLQARLRHDRDAQRERQARYRATHREQVAARQRAYRLEKKLAGICLDCIGPALEDNQCCAKHAEHRRLRDIGIAVISPHATRPDDVTRRYLLELAAITGAAPVESPLIAVVRVLHRLEWPTLGEILEALEVAECNDTERNTWTQNVVRCVRNGWVERRGKHGAREYNLTAAGRAQLPARRRAA